MNWATNLLVDDIGFSPARWVSGRSIRLPYQMLTQASQLAAQQRNADDVGFERRVALLSTAQRSIIGARYNRAMSKAVLGRARAADNASSKLRFAVGDQVMYRRGNITEKSAWAMQWVGPGIVIGHDQHRDQGRREPRQIGRALG